jgi:hypothetical protein
MYLSLAEASKLTGVSKSGLFKSMKRGVFSGVRDEVSGEWRVHVAELQRVYAVKSPETLTVETPIPDHVPARPESAVLAERLRGMEERIEQLTDERNDLRRRLDEESSERRRLTLALTGPRTSAEMSAPVQRVPWTVYLIGLSAVIAAGVAVFLAIRA